MSNRNTREIVFRIYSGPGFEQEQEQAANAPTTDHRQEASEPQTAPNTNQATRSK